MPADAFAEWLNRFAYLSDAQIVRLPEWQRSLALVHQFTLDTISDGAGSLYYNHTENVDNVASAFDALGEKDLAEKIRQVWSILKPFVDGNPSNEQDILVQQCLDGVATSALVELEALVEQRWDALFDKLEQLARAHGWTP